MLAKYQREVLKIVITQQMSANNDKLFHTHEINKNNNNEHLINKK